MIRPVCTVRLSVRNQHLSGPFSIADREILFSGLAAVGAALSIRRPPGSGARGGLRERVGENYYHGFETYGL